MATYNVTERDPENQRVLANRVLSFDDAATAQPAKVNQVSPLGAIAIPLSVRVPAGWYIKLTSTRFTIGVTTYA